MLGSLSSCSVCLQEQMLFLSLHCSAYRYQINQFAHYPVLFVFFARTRVDIDIIEQLRTSLETIKRTRLNQTFNRLYDSRHENSLVSGNLQDS